VSVTICRHGKPVADIVPTEVKDAPKFGTLKGEAFILDPDWWKPQNDIEAWLRGEV
jgi:antitoxin (DNA-binding transcriptional repressor) of toxin-antitoxin stability system